MRLRGPTLSFVFLVAIAAGCGDGPAAPDPSPRLVGGDGALALGVYLPVDASETLIEAGNDVLAAARDVSAGCPSTLFAGAPRRSAAAVAVLPRRGVWLWA